MELADRLSELQKKAALLTTQVAPSSGPGCQQRMNVLLGPASSDSRIISHISGKLFVALKFVPPDQELPVPTNKRLSASCEGELHVNIKEAHNIAGFENPSVAAVMAAASNETAATLERQNSSRSASSSQSNSGSLESRTNNSIRQLPSGSLPNPFCKCYLLASNGQRVAKYKTPHLKRTSNPRWDFKCVFSQVSLANLSSQAIEILMFNRDSILVSNNEFLGGIRLCRSDGQPAEATTTQTNSAADSGSYEDSLCSERESRLWNQMIARPNIWVYGELELRLLRPLVAQPTAIGGGGGLSAAANVNQTNCATN